MSTPDPLPPQLPDDETPKTGAAGFFKSPTTPYPPGGETDRSWAIGMHASGLAGFFAPSIGNVIAPLIIWLIKRPESPYLDEVGKEVVNFQISYSIYGFICALITTLLAIITCGFGGFLGIPLMFALVIVWLVFTVLGIIKTSNGEPHRYPTTIRLIK